MKEGGKKEKNDYVIRKVVQALTLLEQFREDDDELSLAELSRRLCLNERSTLQLIATLKERSYLEQNAGSRNYRLGFKTLELAQTVLRQTGLYRVSHPVLTAISGKCGENVAVSVLRKSHVIELDSVQSEAPVQVVSRVGVHLPIHCTAAGKLLLALEPGAGQENLLEGIVLDRHTANTITELDRLRSQLRCIAEKGYAVDDEELDADVRSVAAPIRDFAGKVVGALVITGPSCRVSRDTLTGHLLTLVLQGAAEISGRLGYHLDREVPGGSSDPEGPPSPAQKLRCSAPRKRNPSAPRTPADPIPNPPAPLVS